VTIVVGFVPTKEGRAALARATEEARTRRSRLVVINSDRGARDVDDETTQAAEADLQRVADELRHEGLDLEVRQLVRGNEPAEDLIAVATETDADLIVIGLRRRTPVGKLILGSNAQRILLDAPCAVLAVKG
jgi:nucleotide-binding universal stress UspA family protein